MLNPVALRALPWRWIGLGLLLVALVVQTLRLDAATERAKRYKADLVSLEQRIKDEAQRQKQVTRDNLERARDGMKQAEGPARKVETAPLPGNCATPREILESPDL